MKHFSQCIGCGRIFPPQRAYVCPKCGDLFQITYDYNRQAKAFRSSLDNSERLSVWRYGKILPVEARPIVTIGEGGTSLLETSRLARILRGSKIYLKNEGQNPTGSFKDRGMTVAITRALQIGAREVICASTGNTSASMAAYAAKAGLKATVLVPKGQVAAGKLLQAIIHGATMVEVEGNFDKALKDAKRTAESRKDLYLVNSINPYRIEGQKTLAFEVWEQLNQRIPDAVVVPVGNAGNISAIWKGFKELTLLKMVKRHPRMIGVQASGAAPLAEAYMKRAEKVAAWEHPNTVATAIQIGAPASWKKALTAIKESNGSILTVTDEEIIRSRHLLADHEGVFAEPASAASIAGLRRSYESGLVASDDLVVCVITGHGLKDQSLRSILPTKSFGLALA